MSDGGAADGKRDDRGLNFGAGADHFGREISRIAVSQICESIGFQGFQGSVLDSLAEIVIRYLRDLGNSSKFYANLAGRTECNVFDVIQGLVDLGFTQGFIDPSEVCNGCVASSDAIREIGEYVASADEVPFPQPISRFPVTRVPRRIPTFLQMGETPSSMHIPLWLPAFPDPHTYIQTPVWNERVSDPRTDRIELVRQHTKAERSLLRLQQRLVRNGCSAAADATSENPSDSGNGLEDYETENSFLAKPMQDGVKKKMLADVSVNSLAEKHASLLETFAPAIEAMKDRLDSGSNGNKTLGEKRNPAFSELNGGRKIFGESVDLRIHCKASHRNAPWFGREDDKDDKKRRIEFILRKSMENHEHRS